jgi:hypothetical protein
VAELALVAVALGRLEPGLRVALAEVVSPTSDGFAGSSTFSWT